MFRPGLPPLTLISEWVLGLLSLGINRPEGGINHSTPSNSEDKNLPLVHVLNSKYKLVYTIITDIQNTFEKKIVQVMEAYEGYTSRYFWLP
jgi:hypothetical protein